MALSKEAKTGLMVSIAALVLILGTYFLKGFNLFSSENTFYCYFDNAQNLIPSSTIQVKGMVVGTVKEVQLQGTERVKVVIGVKKDVPIPQGTTASIFSPDLMSGKALRLDLGTSKTLLKEGDSIPAKIELGLMDKVGTQIDPVLANANTIMHRLDSIMAGIQQVLNPELKANINSSVASLDKTMKNFAALSSTLNAESAHLAGILRNANTITATVAQNGKNIDGILTNLKNTTEKLNKADLDKTIHSLQSTLDQTQALLNKINKGEGSLGMLANDKQLYLNLSNSVQSMSNLMDDLKKHPSRYINIRVFGKAPKETP